MTFARGRSRSGGQWVGSTAADRRRAWWGWRLGLHPVAPMRPGPHNDTTIAEGGLTGSARTTMVKEARRREHADALDPAMGGPDLAVEPALRVLATLGERDGVDGEGASHGAARCAERRRGLGRGS
jgi:hypothetical protein